MEPLYSGHPEEQNFGRIIYSGGLYSGVVLYTNRSFGTWVPGRYTEVPFMPLKGAPLYASGACALTPTEAIQYTEKFTSLVSESIVLSRPGNCPLRLAHSHGIVHT